MPNLDLPLLIAVIAGACTVFGMILATACIFSVDTPRVRRVRR